ncbi:Protein ROOT PRIMORDIUM DEFECTIVE 1 [Ananas comosus]|uniref:Protein ROOT PRIMORDIUM DEFECTIVE 1 n=1 Tax=Ananas comosus TaxID=4615 RepID=A0A199V902_ANACO|nr:Protein ROOT PRIMORDIUM DEFECTIVE 1 [Ananas comosus]
MPSSSSLFSSLTAASSASAAAAGRAARNVVVSPTQGVSSLKVPWRRDPALDSAIERDKRYGLCWRVVREVLAEPGRRIPLRYLEKRRPRLRLPLRVPTFLRRYPNLFELYPDRIRPSSPSPAVPFLRPSPSLLSFLALRDRLLSLHEPLLLAKLVKLLMMSRHRALPADKLLCVKRDFGFPDDLLTSLVPAHPDLLRLSGHPGHGPCFVELVAWDHSYARSAVEARADAESELTGVRMRPNFAVRLPRGFYLKKEMREWARDWLELPYISPYADASALHPASREMEKRAVGLLHELLSLTLHKRAAVPILGKFCDEFRLSNAFASAFTRHPGIFYVSLKGGIKTAMLREAYDELGELVDRDPLLAIKDKFVEMMEEGHRDYMEAMKRRKEELERDLELMAAKNAAETGDGGETS